MLLLSPQQIREEENRGVKNGVSFSEMMDYAGKNAAEVLDKHYPNAKNIVILCGKGSNGGDGFVVADYYARKAKDVTVVRVFDCESNALSEQKFRETDKSVRVISAADKNRLYSVLENADMTIDAVFGIGFRGELPEDVKNIFDMVKTTKAVRAALDIPSGLNIENKDIHCFDADITVCMHALKPEHVYKPFAFHCGKIECVNIGFEPKADEKKYAFLSDEIKHMLPQRPFYANKGTFGKAMLIAGSKTMTGAAVIAAKGAIHGGVGLLTLATPEVCLPTVQNHLLDCTFLPLRSDPAGKIAMASFKLIMQINACSAVAVGCGLGQSEEVTQAVAEILRRCLVPLILDADGINAVAGHSNIWKEAKCPVLLTPHPGEMARLTGKSIAEIEDNREKTASAFAGENKVYVLLKGANTVVAAPDGRIAVNTTGCEALARGGSGDLLTGIVLALLAQGLEPFNALCVGAYVHGLSGDIAKSRYTSFASSVERIIDCIPKAFLQILEK